MNAIAKAYYAFRESLHIHVPEIHSAVGRDIDPDQEAKREAARLRKQKSRKRTKRN